MPRMEIDTEDYHDEAPGNDVTAAQACTTCRKQKRKCDKKIPSCSLCLKNGRTCDYVQENTLAAPSAGDFSALQQKVAALEQLLSERSASDTGSSRGTRDTSSQDDFAATSSLFKSLDSQKGIRAPLSSHMSLFFLDSYSCEYRRIQLHMPHVAVPSGALAVLGNSSKLREMIEEYFVTMHAHFPVVSKIRLYQHLANPMHEPGADIALLFLAMKLSTSIVGDGMSPETQEYHELKSLFNHVESSNLFSIQMLHALLLLCLYELGHGIYPAAYISIGRAARLGHAMGLHQRSAPKMLPPCVTWTEQEERRRVWWAIMILDRFVSVGNSGKPFATSDPSLDMHLPIDDDNWDRGIMAASAPLILSASQSIRAAPFARTCQASHLLGKIRRHLNDENLPQDFRFEEAIQLHRAARALSEVLPGEARIDDVEERNPGLATSVGICYSALLTLYDGYACGERATQDSAEALIVMQHHSIEGLREFSGKVLVLARQIRRCTEMNGLSRVSPFIIDCLYQAAANYCWYVHESSNQDDAASYAELKDVLQIIDQRWKVAGEYIRILEASEVYASYDFE